MKKRWVGVSAGLALLGGAAAFADVMSLDLRTMVHKYADVAVVGTIEAVTWSEFPLDDGSPAAYTNLRVKGENLYTGQPRTVVASYVGGMLGGEMIFSSEQPTAGETQVGKKVVVFTAPWASRFGNAPERCLVAQHGGIFLVQPGPQGEVVLGKGEGYAVSRNLLLSDLKAQAAELWRTKPRQPR